jgi:hypothetical protein
MLDKKEKEQNSRQKYNIQESVSLEEGGGGRVM